MHATVVAPALCNILDFFASQASSADVVIASPSREGWHALKLLAALQVQPHNTSFQVHDGIHVTAVTAWAGCEGVPGSLSLLCNACACRSANQGHWPILNRPRDSQASSDTGMQQGFEFVAATAAANSRGRLMCGCDTCS